MGSIGGAGRVFSNVDYAPEMEARRGFMQQAKIKAEGASDKIFANAIQRARKKIGMQNL